MNDSIGLYLNDIGKVALLTAEDERELSKAIEAGRDAATRLEAGERGAALRRDLRNAATAKDRFIRSNLRLVVSIARRYPLPQGMDLLDLIQEGNLGLEHAVDKFDWRLRQARLTHGVRAVIWHQGENDQPADNPLGRPGHEIYAPLFLEMAAGWQRDLPNARRYFMFQIWPNSCAMGGDKGAGDRLREAQRTLPELFDNLSILSTLGIRPPGGCHYPKEGYNEFARMLHPLIGRDLYGRDPSVPFTPPNLKRVSFANAEKDALTLEFDQGVVWLDSLATQFYLDGEPDRIASGSAKGNTLTLKLKSPATEKKITYLQEKKWSQDTLLVGENGLAALTFCDATISLSNNASSQIPKP